MPERTYRVVQWATGTVGKTAIRHFADNPVYELVGVLVTNPRKVGKDAGDIAKIAPTGVIATDDVEAIIALDADCVHFSPLVYDVDMVCRLLRSGKNVVNPVGPYFPWERWKPDLERIAEACADGGASYHGSGIHPGFTGDLLSLTAARVMSRIDHIHHIETIDNLANPSAYIEFMGFGRSPEDLIANPGRSPDAPYIFAQSMEMVARGLGLTIDEVTARFDVATATRDIEYDRGKGEVGVIRKGTVAGQHYEWTGWTQGRPLISYHCFWTMGEDNSEPRWDSGPSGYRIRIDGEPPTEVTLAGQKDADGNRKWPGLPWTAMMGVNVIPAVCDAPPGIVTHFELGVPQLHGLFRP